MILTLYYKEEVFIVFKILQILTIIHIEKVKNTCDHKYT